MKNNVYIILLLTLLGCRSGARTIEEIVSAQHKEYREVHNIYNEFLDISHFPKKKSDTSATFVYTPLEDKHEIYEYIIPFSLLLWEHYHENTTEYHLEKEKLKLQCPHINATDSSIMYIISTSEAEMEQLEHVKKITRHNLNVGTPPPIPLIENVNDCRHTPALDSTYTIYIYEAKPILIVPEKYHVNAARGIVPKEWEHGYSRGVIISDIYHEIIYWAVAW